MSPSASWGLWVTLVDTSRLLAPFAESSIGPAPIRQTTTGPSVRSPEQVTDTPGYTVYQTCCFRNGISTPIPG